MLLNLYKSTFYKPSQLEVGEHITILLKNYKSTYLVDLEVLSFHMQHNHVSQES